MDIDKVREILSGSVSPVILTGAGISAESGVPTFRDKDGLWRNHSPQDLATPEAFERDPFLVWEWYDWRRSVIASKTPNQAHRALAALEKRKTGLTLITQNVDGLHTLAGSRNVLEVHGSIWRTRCVECGNSSENRDVPISILPRCRCGAVLRPDVVWFGEALPEGLFARAFEASSNADLMMVIGTAGVVQPAASFALRAKDAGAFLVEVNLEETPLTKVMDVSLIGRAGEVLPRLI